MDYNYIDCNDDLYGELFDSYNNAPEKLYYLGDVNILRGPVTAVIGKRDTKLRKIANQFGELVVANGNTLLNGFALGCDSFAIQGALSSGGKVIAVLPCGINSIYPARNSLLARDIVSSGGCIISQFEPNYQVTKHSFIERDRLLAILAYNLLVVDSEVNGGTMHTVKFAKKYGKNIGCYTDSEGRTPAGNQYMLDKMDAVSIRCQRDLNSFLLRQNYCQLTIF